ncbi:Xylanolytic transcriptional activator xlnR like protein [Verticillium longisporum]|uniref:Xylanolytic transcriptional activator xlnR like protein n=1 Tax=Verticillium longisporum TaxID=100787 RepID=A0A8I3AYS4_VERLO|nr:Xylanolytic transcriptional activator xlnR like protein [Verticillium longisporum]
MLSNPLHRFSPYHAALPASTLFSNGHAPANHPHPSGMNEMSQGYALQQQLQHAADFNWFRPYQEEDQSGMRPM